MKDSLKRIQAIIRDAEIRGIRLTEASISSRIRTTAEVPDDAVADISRNATLSGPMEQGNLYVLAEMAVHIVPDGGTGKDDPFVGVRAVYELHYLLPAEAELLPADLQLFAELNGTYNAYPYFREFVQSAFCRLNLPAFTLPLLKASDLAPVEKTSTESTHPS